jgi:hypothetical protein
MKMRRYLNDCSSWEGFNTGYYIDEGLRSVKSTEEAEELCKEFLKKKYGDEVEIIEMDSGDSFQVITGYYDEEGKSLSKDQYDAALMKHGREPVYRYVYVSYYFEDERSP